MDRSENPASLNVEDTWQSGIDEIDRQREELYCQYKQLGEQRNARLPISRLPNEILAHIFSFRVISQQSEFYYNFLPGSPRSWHIVLQVSRHWRAVAFETPELWSCWNFVSLNWHKVFMERSKASPISIRASVTNVSTYRAILDALRERRVSDRVQELRLKGNLDSIDLGLAKVFQSEEPRTSRLEYIGLRSSRQMSLTFDSKTTYPALRKLHISGIQLSVDSPFLKSSNNLTQLVLESGIRFQNVGDILAFASVLQQNSRLEVLYLEVFPSQATAMTGKATSVTLPCLSRLQIKGFLPSCAPLVRCMSYPAKTDVSYNVFASPTTVSGALDLISNHYTNCSFSLQPIAPTQFLGIVSEEARLSIKFLQPKNDSMQPITAFLLMLRTTGATLTDQFISELCSAFPLEQVSSLKCCDYVFPSADLDPNTGILSRFTKLETLEMEWEGVDDLIPALTRHSALMPRLSNLRLVSFTFALPLTIDLGVISLLRARGGLQLELVNCRDINEDLYELIQRDVGGGRIVWDRVIMGGPRTTRHRRDMDFDY